MVNLAMASSVRSNDLIIGPVFPDAIKTFADFSELGQTLQISPLAASMPAEFNNPGLVTVNNTINQHGQKIAEFIHLNYKPELVNVLLINTQKTEDAKFSFFFKSALTKISAPRSSWVEFSPVFSNTAPAEAISAFDISMMNLCEFL